MHDNHIKHGMLTTVAGGKMLMMTGNKEGAIAGTEEANWTEKRMMKMLMMTDNKEGASSVGGTEEASWD